MRIKEEKRVELEPGRARMTKDLEHLITPAVAALLPIETLRSHWRDLKRREHHVKTN